MAAQHQHYVPKLLLRGFLSGDPERALKEQVHVLDLEAGKSGPLAEQSGRKLASAVSTKRAGNVAISADEELTEIRLCPRERNCGAAIW